jgi:hypothetical protein
MATKTKATKTKAKTHASKPRMAPGREAKGVAPKRVTMTAPGIAVTHEPVQAGELVSHAPPTPSMLVQAGHNAGTLCGYRQALKACADNLRAQAQELRSPGVVMALRGGVSGVSKLLHGDAQADLLDACAAAIEAQHAARAAEEQSHARAAEALLAAAGAK